MQTHFKKYWLLYALSVAFIIVLSIGFSDVSDKKLDFADSAATRSQCNIGVIPVEGFLSTVSESDVINSLDISLAINKMTTEDYEGIVFLIDSYGGTAAAAEEIGLAIEQLEVPTVAMVRSSAFSGGYWVTAATDYVVSLSTAGIGNIGVTRSYVDEIKLNDIKGYGYQEIVTGEFKEVGNINKFLTKEHKAYLQERVDDTFKIFSDAVKRNRNMSDEEFAQVSDAKYYLAADAIELGLIDEIGGVEQVKSYIAEQRGLDSGDLLLCEPVKFL